MVTSREDKYLGFRLKDFEVIGTPERHDSFVVMRARKSGTPGERLIFRSRENLLNNTILLEKLLNYAEFIAAAHKSTLHVDREMFAPTEGEPNLFMWEIPGSGHQALSEVIATTNLPELTALGYVRQILDSLSAFHQRDLVYGAINPRFVFLVGPSGAKTVKLGGLFHVHKAGEQFPIGYNPEFTAPDLPGDDISDKAKDVYSVGMLAYRMLLSRDVYEDRFQNAFKATTDTDRSNAWQRYHQDKYGKNTPFTALDVLDPNIAPSVSSIVERMMNIASQDRFNDALEAKQALAAAIRDAEIYHERMRQIRNRGQDLDPPPPLRVVEKKRKFGVGVVALAASLVTTAVVAGGYYQFAYKPREAERALNAAALTQSTERADAQAAELSRLRKAAIEAVGKLDPSGDAALLLAAAEETVKALQAESVARTPSDIDAYAERMVAASDKFAKVLQAVERRRGDARAELSKLDSAIAALSGVSPAGDAVFASLSASSQAIQARLDDGAYDAVVAEASGLVQRISSETGTRERMRTEAEEIARQFAGLLESLTRLVPNGSTVLSGFGEKLASARDAVEAKRFAEARDSLQSELTTIQAELSNRQELRERALNSTAEVKSAFEALKARVALLSSQGSLLPPSISEAISTAEVALEGNRFEDALSLLDRAKSVLAETNEALVRLSSQAEQAIGRLADLLSQLTASLPVDAAPKADLIAALAEARAAKQAGDYVAAARIASEAADETDKEQAVIAGLRDDANAARQSAKERLILVENTTPLAPGLADAQARFQQASAAFEQRDYTKAKTAFEEVLDSLVLLDRSLTTASADLSAQVEALKVQIADLRARGAGAAEIERLEEQLNEILRLLATGDIEQGRNLLVQSLDVIKRLDADLLRLQQNASELIGQAEVLIADFAAVQYLEERDASRALQAALDIAKKAFADNQFDAVLARLGPQLDAAREIIGPARARSEAIADALALAENTKAAAEEAGGAILDGFARGVAQLNQAKQQLEASEYDEGVANLAAAAVAFQTVLDQLGSVQKEVQDLSGQLAVRLSQAREMQVAPEPDLAEIEEGANADYPSPGEKVAALEGALAKLGELIAAVEQARPAAEEARLAADEVFARLESVAGILANPAYATLSDDYRAAGVLMDAGAFVAAQSAYVALIEPGNALHASLTRPPRMTCDVEEIPGGMRQVDEGVYPLGDLVTSRRFQDNFGSRLGLTDEQIEVAQFCIQVRPLLLSELGGFVADIRQDPMSFSKLPETVRNPKNPAAPVSGLSRVIVDQYARWLSQKTGRVVRLPTLAELLVADSLAERKEGEVPDNKLVWTAEQCTSQFGLIAMVAKNPRLSTTECRLMLSNLHSDVYVRLVLEAGPPAEAKSGEEAAGRSDVGN